MSTSLLRNKKLFFLFLILPDWWQRGPVHCQKQIRSVATPRSDKL
jgi:hypothetical protein